MDQSREDKHLLGHSRFNCVFFNVLSASSGFLSQLLGITDMAAQCCTQIRNGHAHAIYFLNYFGALSGASNEDARSE